jgi:hypothetical protein
MLLVACSACRVAPQPGSARTVAAYEIPLPTALDRAALIDLLSEEARAEGFHVDASSDEVNKQLSEVSPLTINAAVWRGKDDDEPIASVMDGADHPGLAWLTFSKSETPGRTARLKARVMKRIMLRWPKTQALPIMPTGAIPLHDDLVRTRAGYRVKRAAASKYALPPSSPLAAGD